MAIGGGELSRISARTAAEVCGRFELSPEARELRLEDLSPRGFLDLALEKGHYADAIRFLAHALPKPEAVRWALACAREAAASNEDRSAAAEAVAQTEKWLKDPTEEHRRAAFGAAEKAGFATPAGAVALAAFLSGGSLAPPDFQAVPPPDNASAQAVAAAVLVSAVFQEPQKAPAKFRAFLSRGIRIAEAAE